MKKSLMVGAAALLLMAACSSKKAEAENTEAAESTTTETTVEQEAPAAFTIPTDAKVDTTGYTATDSGLLYKEIKAGKGTKPTAESTVKVHYTGKHLNGETFDSSVERGEAISFPLNRVIPGWTEGVQLMSEGAKYQFIIPSDLAYGPQGTPGGPIAPNEPLYFEVELIQVEK